MSNAAWSFASVLGEHKSLGFEHHVESLAFRGASLADLLAQAAKGVVVLVDDAPVSSTLATVAPKR